MACLITQCIALVCVLILTCSLPSYGQKESEIVSRYRAALGRGAEDIPDPPCVFQGTIKMGKITFNGIMYYRKPNVRMELSMQGLTFISVQNDTISWSYNPVEDKHEVNLRTREESEQETERELTFDFASKDIINYKARGHKLKLTGIIKMDSLEVYALELTRKNDTKIEFYLDTKTHLIYKIQAEGGHRYYANYSPYGDYVYPSFISDDQLEMVMSKIDVNVPIPDSLFTIPQTALDAEHKRQKYIEALLANGDSLQSKEDFAGAIRLYSEVLEYESNNYFAYNSRGLSKIHLQKYYEAISDFNTALEIQPNGSRAFNNRGLAKFYLGDNQGALDDYNAAITIDSVFVTAYKNRGLVYLRSGQYTEAADDFSKAVKWNAEDGEAHFKYGVAIAQLERYEEAIISYQKALALKYKTAEVYNYKGVSEYRLGHYDSAVLSFKTALDLETDHLQYLENYGNALYRLEDYSSALTQFEKYLKLKNDNPEIHNLIGLCKFQDEDYHSAIRNFSRSIEINPKSAIYYDNRAAAKEQLEDYEGAISDYTQSISIYPNDPEVFFKRGLIKIYTSKKIEGCMDLGTANDMKYEPAKDAILKNCN